MCFVQGCVACLRSGSVVVVAAGAAVVLTYYKTNSLLFYVFYVQGRLLLSVLVCSFLFGRSLKSMPFVWPLHGFTLL